VLLPLFSILVVAALAAELATCEDDLAALAIPVALGRAALVALVAVRRDTVTGRAGPQHFVGTIRARRVKVVVVLRLLSFPSPETSHDGKTKNFLSSPRPSL
jgi:hypothetical protein